MIIGAGVAGIAMAHQLKRFGFTNFTMVEKAADIGGVWRDNTYPGAACDVPSALYSLSEMPITRWSRRYAEQPEILQYLRRLVLAGGLDLQLRTRTEVVEMTFDEQAGRWRLVTESSETIWCDVVISAVGQLSRPHTPNIAGEDTFGGAALSFGALGPFGITARQGSSRHRDRRKRDTVRTTDRTRGTARNAVSAHGTVDFAEVGQQVRTYSPPAQYGPAAVAAP